MGAGASALDKIEGQADKEIYVFRQMVEAYKRESSHHGISDEGLFTKLSKVLEKASHEALDGNVAGGGQSSAAWLGECPLSASREGAASSSSITSTPSSSFKCPTRRFGRTELPIPIITCGGMRMQQTWKPQEGYSLADVSSECQANFEAIVDRAMSLGICHFETAKGYGCSEIQYGKALKGHDREKMVVQTKVRPFDDIEEFRKTLDTSLANLDTYIDLFGFHGINKPEHLDWIMRPGGCLEVVREYQKAGDIRFIGFSTHAPTPLIVQAIETDVFDYVNLHYHFIGSYTSSGTGKTSMGNHEAIEAAIKHDMGVFIISPSDKGGMLYKPSKCFARACEPFSPIVFNDLWLWSRQDPAIHTLVVGAARPSDFDEHVEAAKQYMEMEKHGGTFDRIREIETKLMTMYNDVWSDWSNDWWVGLPDCYGTPTGIHIAEIIWLWSVVKAWGLHEYAVMQYSKLEGQVELWDPKLPPQENWVKVPFDWTPGLPYNTSIDVTPYIPEARQERLLAILREADYWLGKDTQAHVKDPILQLSEWEPLYNLQPDIPFPERPENQAT